MKTKLILIASVLIVSMAIVVSIKVGVKRANTIKTLKANEKSYVDSVRSYKDRYGYAIYEKYGLQKTVSELKNDIKLLQTTKASGVKVKEVISYVTVGGRIDTVVSVKREPKDSCYHFTINNEFNSTFCVTKDSAFFHPTITNTQELLLVGQRETVGKRSPVFFIRWFQKKHTVIKAIVRNSNQAIKVNEINSTYTIDE